jgi:uncharacterized tellurite resistance protein B-like protein
MLSRLLERIRQPDEQTVSEDDLVIAAAALFLEVAWADHDIAEEELSIVRKALADTFGLAQEAIEEIIQDAHDHHDDSVGIYGFTRAINENWSLERRTDLVVQLWRLALADDDLSKYEEYTIRKIADMLYIGHSAFIQAKLTAKRSSAAG